MSKVAFLCLSILVLLTSFAELVKRAADTMAVCEQHTSTHSRCRVHQRMQSPTTPNPLTLVSAVPTLYRSDVDPLVQVQNMVCFFKEFSFLYIFFCSVSGFPAVAKSLFEAHCHEDQIVEHSDVFFLSSRMRVLLW